MSIILELRDRYSQGSITLLHKSSEDVLVANVFGILKNLPHSVVLWPWLTEITGVNYEATEEARVRFWQSQTVPIGKAEGSTKVDVVIETDAVLIFVEAKLDAEASIDTTHDPDRDQLTRNLDVGYSLAFRRLKDFRLIYLTTDEFEPPLVRDVCARRLGFDLNPSARPEDITSRLHWAAWETVGVALARAYQADSFTSTERHFALDLLAYLAKKDLWQSTLGDDELFYTDPLLTALTKSDSEFSKKHRKRRTRDQSWTRGAWSEAELRDFLHEFKNERGRALLKLIATYGGAVRQKTILSELAFLADWRDLQRLKSVINAACRDHNRARILSWGSGSGDQRLHELNPSLGALRDVVIAVAKSYEIKAHLL